MTAPKILPVVLYGRVSTKDKDQDPEVQLRALRPWVAARGWPIAGEFTDKVTGDETRRRRDPPGLSQAMQLLEQHRARVLAIYSAERLVRSPLGILRIVARVEQMGCHVASLLDGGDLDTTSDTGELLLFLRGWHSRMALRMLRKGTKDGMEEARARGVVLGRPLSELPDPEQVRSLMAEGLGRRRVAARLGVPEWAVRQALKMPTGKAEH